MIAYILTVTATRNGKADTSVHAVLGPSLDCAIRHEHDNLTRAGFLVQSIETKLLALEIPAAITHDEQALFSTLCDAESQLFYLANAHKDNELLQQAHASARQAVELFHKATGCHN